LLCSQRLLIRFHLTPNFLPYFLKIPSLNNLEINYENFPKPFTLETHKTSLYSKKKGSRVGRYCAIRMQMYLNLGWGWRLHCRSVQMSYCSAADAIRVSYVSCGKIVCCRVVSYLREQGLLVHSPKILPTNFSHVYLSCPCHMYVSYTPFACRILISRIPIPLQHVDTRHPSHL
jgi:hypothetical protein